MDLTSKKVFFLMSFGHCGVDWLHTLFDSHPEILILPEISFYRIWKIIDGDSINTYNEVFLAFLNYLENHPYRAGEENKLFSSKGKKKIFFDRFKLNLSKNGFDRKTVFFSIHEAYAYAHSIDIDSIKIIIEQEHVCFQSKLIFDDFVVPNFLFILRDPRASIAGYYRGIQRKCGSDMDCSQHLRNKSLTEWTHAVKIWNKNKNKENIMIIKNELLVKNLENEMISISNFLGIKYNDTLTKSTLSNGGGWKVDSSYVSRNDTEVDKSTYFDPVNVEKRWMSILGIKDIIMIESMFDIIMREFNYTRITKSNLMNNIFGIYYIAMPCKKWRDYNRDKFFSAIFTYFLDIKENLSILKGDGSKKYD
mgnify:CR=1 FL=1